MLVDDWGRPLNADFSIEAEGGGLSLVLESAGGKKRGGGVRNADYNDALELLLRRLGDRRAVVRTALVDSRATQRLAEADRLLVHEPLRLTSSLDFGRLRMRLTSAQGRIGQREGAPKAGNNSKRIRLRLEVPGYGPPDGARLQRELEGVRQDVVWPTGRAEFAARAEDELRVRIGEELPGGGRIVAVPGGAVVVETSRGFEEIPLDEVQAGLDRFAENGKAPVSGLVDALVAVAVGAEVDGGQAVVSPPKRTNRQFAGFDGRAFAKYRKEQGALRKLLVRGAGQAECALCGRPFPVEFLIAAHIKARKVASSPERQDLENIAMLACSFGCDRLFELGYVAVDERGVVLTTSTGGPLDLHLRLLEGRRSGAFTDRSAKYFRWHRENVFRGTGGA
ncbi:hypothetical protein FHX81_6173 [Saccharothrix saharensis]|uniref:HNH endonuclease n=1 Tax=Saccharothrix saharensis TaxID=571190 RepID=A0A543JLL8_9PSEU|nr:hypothetical protein [Saccharothrix saharensis]TQM83746.1 hypothetical protein FHX81_6173 [Saccharothrix saharensis]